MRKPSYYSVHITSLHFIYICRSSIHGFLRYVVTVALCKLGAERSNQHLLACTVEYFVTVQCASQTCASNYTEVAKAGVSSNVKKVGLSVRTFRKEC